MYNVYNAYCMVVSWQGTPDRSCESGVHGVNNQAEPEHSGPDEAIVRREDIAAAVQAAAEIEPSCELDLITGEPLLSAYLRDGVLQVLGKLALAGAGPRVVEGIAEDFFRLLNVAVNSTRSGYRALLDGLLPDPGAGNANGDSGETPQDSSGPN